MTTFIKALAFYSTSDLVVFVYQMQLYFVYLFVLFFANINILSLLIWKMSPIVRLVDMFIKRFLYAFTLITFSIYTFTLMITIDFSYIIM